jgi:hypothetical protein
VSSGRLPGAFLLRTQYRKAAEKLLDAWWAPLAFLAGFTVFMAAADVLLQLAVYGRVRW